MKLRATALLTTLLFAVSAHASSDAAASPSPTPGLVYKTLVLLHIKHPPKPANAPQLHHNLELKLDLAPNPFQLSVDREIKATLSVYNRSKKYVHLDFPTSQRIEVLVRDTSGKVVDKWSEDQSFTNDPAAVTVNPGERLEYTASVPTRDMAVGKSYIIEASFPSYPDMTIQQQVVPQK